jgi:hypothetical protein
MNITSRRIIMSQLAAGWPLAETGTGQRKHPPPAEAAAAASTSTPGPPPTGEPAPPTPRTGGGRGGGGGGADAHITRQLRALYDEVVNEPIPERLLRLLEDLDSKRSERS